MYAQLKEEKLRMLACDVTLLRQRTRLAAEREFKALQLHMHQLNQEVR